MRLASKVGSYTIDGSLMVLVLEISPERMEGFRLWSGQPHIPRDPSYAGVILSAYLGEISLYANFDDELSELIDGGDWVPIPDDQLLGKVIPTYEEHWVVYYPGYIGALARLSSNNYADGAEVGCEYRMRYQYLQELQDRLKEDKHDS